MRIGFLGVGDMATYMISGLCQDGDGRDILLSPRNAEQSAGLAARFGCRVAANNAGVVSDSDLVVLAVRPADAAAVISGLPWRAEQTLVSVVAGATLDDLASARPATCVRSMPVSCAAICESPTAIYPDNAPTRQLYERIGSVVVLPDEATFAAASVMGAYHGWTFGVIKVVTDWLEGQGIPSSDARALVAGMMRGAAGVALAEPAKPLSETLRSLTTPGGITEAGFRKMAEVTGLDAWPAACRAALRHMED
jgi:pyrroline-5-carboxylate reductase